MNYMKKKIVFNTVFKLYLFKFFFRSCDTIYLHIKKKLNKISRGQIKLLQRTTSPVQWPEIFSVGLSTSLLHNTACMTCMTPYYIFTAFQCM